MGRSAKLDATIGGYVRVRRRDLCSTSAKGSTTYDLVRAEPTVDKPWRRWEVPGETGPGHETVRVDRGRQSLGLFPS